MGAIPTLVHSNQTPSANITLIPAKEMLEKF